MTGREKIESAFSADGTAEIPVAICYEGILVRDHWEELTSHPWWYRHTMDIEPQMQWRRDMAARVPQDWIQVPPCSGREQRKLWELDVRSDGVFWIDKRTGKERELKRPAVAGWHGAGDLHSIRPERLIETVEEIDDKVPVPADFDADAFRAQGRDELARRIEREFPDRFLVSSTGSPLWRCYPVWGFEGMMMMVAERPDLVEHACRRALPGLMNRVREGAACGAQGIWIEECFTDMVSPEAFRRLGLPFVRAITDEIRSLGMRSIYYFCGDPAGKWDMLLDAGADALALEETKKSFVIGIDEVADHVAGRGTILGNLDSVGVLQDGTEAQLRAEIERQIAAGRRNGSRFIMGLGSPVTPSTSIDRVRLFCDLVHELGS